MGLLKFGHKHDLHNHNYFRWFQIINSNILLYIQSNCNPTGFQHVTYNCTRHMHVFILTQNREKRTIHK